jgi:hypothetical protein
MPADTSVQLFFRNSKIDTGGKNMKSALRVFGVCSLAFLFMAGMASAVKPGEQVNPNGFPSGPHFNLNILGKKDTFSCPEQQYYLRVTADNNLDGDLNQLVEVCDDFDVCEPTTTPIYGNVVFIPETGTGIELYIKSGTAKKFADITQLQVTDPCSGFGEGAAVVEMPKCDGGYRVYARSLGKPTGEPSIGLVSDPSLTLVQDEDGNNLVYIGSFSSNGFETPDGRIYRTKGKSTAIDISPMFKWSGTVCDFEALYTEPCLGDPDGDGIMNTSPMDEYGACPFGYFPLMAFCGSDTNGDGLLDAFEAPVDGACSSDGYAIYYGDVNSCTEFELPTWVFNIAAFVDYLWSLDNQGLKHLQLRFYPNCVF